MRKVMIWGFVVVSVSILCFLNVTPVERRTLNPGDTTALNAVASKPMPVEVTNFPATQNVAGTLNVGNMPVDANGDLRVVGNLQAVPASLHFVGITSESILPPNISKVVLLSRACAAEFPNTRICEDIDLDRQIPPPPEFTSPAWVMQISSEYAMPVAWCQDSDGYCTDLSAHPVACCGY